MKSFPSHRSIALKLLDEHPEILSRKAGSFLGQCCVDPTPLTDKQIAWLDTLLSKAGLPALADGGPTDGLS